MRIAGRGEINKEIMTCCRCKGEVRMLPDIAVRNCYEFMCIACGTMHNSEGELLIENEGWDSDD